MKKFFKRIGKAIKSGVKKFGKFMNKVGVVGQIAMFFIAGGVGGLLMKGLMKGIGSLATTLGASGNSILQGVGAVLNGAHEFATTVGNTYNTVTSAMLDFGKTALNKIPGVNMELSGPGGWLENAKINVSEIGDPFTKTISGQGRTLADISKTTGMPIDELARANVGLTKGIKLENWGDIVVPEGDSIYTKLTALTGESVDTRSIYGPAKEAAALGGDAKVISSPFEDPSHFKDLDGGLHENLHQTPPPATLAGGETSGRPMRAVGAEIDSLLSPEDISGAIQREAEERVANSVTALEPSEGWEETLKRLGAAREGGFGLNSPVPEEEGIFGDLWGAANKEIRENYGLYGEGSPGTITAAKNIFTDVSLLLPPDDAPDPTPYAGTPILLDTYNSDQLKAHNTVMIPALQQMQQNNGLFGYSSYLDSQISYSQRMLQENQRGRFSPRGVA